MKKTEGFTLIELMIVIAIIAIIAAIAIPGLLQSQRASNERNASASLKTIASAEADFRANDRDANRIQDFWSGNVSGLYSIKSLGTTEMIKLIEISIATADFDSTLVGATAIIVTATAANTNSWVTPAVFGVPSPKAGYWYDAMNTDETTVATGVYATNTSGVVDVAGAIGVTDNRNHSKFGFMAFPDSFSAGRSIFFINEGNTIFKRPITNNVRPAGVTPNTNALIIANVMGGAAPVPENWPTDTQLKALYSKLD